MNYQKVLTYLIVIFSTSIVVFNSTTDLLEKLFKPTFNLLYFTGFGLLTLATIWYVVYNWKR
jgi:hypothetical protein